MVQREIVCDAYDVMLTISLPVLRHLLRAKVCRTPESRGRIIC